MKKRTIKKIRQSNRKMQIIVIILFVLTLLPSLVFAATQTAEVSASDLTLAPSDILFSPEKPTIGQPVNITAIVHNIGRFTARNIPVDFYIDSTSIIQKEIDEIRPDSQKSSSINFIFLSAGSHNVTVKIDANNVIIEQNEENNQATKIIDIAGIPPTEPSTISLTAYPEVIEANGIGTSTITALVTDEFGRGISGIKVIFNTSLGTIDSPKITSDGIATTTLTSSTSPGTAVVKGRVDLKDVLVNDTVLVAFVRTDVVKADNVTEIGLNQTYTSSDARVGTIKSCIDVVFDKLLRNVRLEMSQFDDPDFIDPELKDTIADALEAVFGLEGVSASDAKSRTPVVIQSKLYAKNLTKEDVKEVPIEITIGKEWFKDVTQENVNNLRIFKINVTTGKVKSEDVTIVAETDTNVTFLATFDHFCVFALVARPPVAAPPPLIVRPRGGVRPTPTPELEIPPVPRDTTAPIMSNVTVTIERYVIISWDTNEKSDSLVKCGMKSEQYTIEEHAPDYVLFHVIPLKQIRLKNIYENTTYYFVVNSTDPSGNSAQTEEYVFVLTPPEHRRAIMPIILQIPLTLYTHMWWLLLAAIIVLIITVMVMPRYKSRRNFYSLIGKPVGTEILMYLYTTFPNVSHPVDISERTSVDLNGVLEALHTMSNKNKLERLLGIGLVDKVECDGKACYRISKRGKSLMDGLK